MTSTGIKTDTKMLLKSGSKTRVNIDSEIWTKSLRIWVAFLIEFNFIKIRTCQFVNGTFKSMLLVKFNMMIIKDWWFNFMMTDTGSNIDSGKGLKSGKNIGVIIELRSGIELPSWYSGSHSFFNLRKGITCQNINVVPKILILVKFKWVYWNWSLVSKTTWFLGPNRMVSDVKNGQRVGMENVDHCIYFLIISDLNLSHGFNHLFKTNWFIVLLRLGLKEGYEGLFWKFW